MKKQSINDADREEWVENDEGLYAMARSSRLGLREWVRQNRTMIDGVIERVNSGEKRAHYLAYGGR